MRIHEKIRVYIKSNGLQEAIVAKNANIPLNLFNAIMSGKKTMDIDCLRSICYALSARPETFIEYYHT